MTQNRIADFQVAGEGKVTVFLLHGAYGSKKYFEKEMETLVNNGYRVVAWDAPGYGLSTLPAGGLSIEKLAQAAAELIDFMGSETNIVLGHSMGGIVAPKVAELRRDRVHGVIVSATVGSFDRKTPEDKKTFLEERIEPMKQGKSFKETAMPVILSMFFKDSAGPLVDQVIEVAASTKKETFIEAISSIVNYEGVETLKNMSVPVLLIAGEDDKVGRPDIMRENLAIIPDSELVVIPKAGHYAFAEQHDAFNEAVLTFIKERVVATVDA